MRNLARPARFGTCILVVGVVACGGGREEESTAVVREAVGEPMGTFPSADERLALMAVNRARSDPSVVKGPQSTVYPARPPILWHYDLNRSARFHAKNLQSANTTIMHTSPCKLNTNIGTSGCDGTTSCACATAVPNLCRNCANVAAVNTCGTDSFTRIGYFTDIATGEVTAGGYPDSFSAVADWIDEPAGGDGHRQNLLDVGITSNVMGAGRAGGSSCWASFDIIDQGFQSGVVIPKIPTASVKPVRGAAGATYTYYATWADPLGGMPLGISVVIDGTCHAMTRELGSASLNSTWVYAAALTAGCHSYFFVARDAASATVEYPTTGTLVVGAGATCAEFQASAHVYSCFAGADAGEAGAGDAIAGDATADASADASAKDGGDAAANDGGDASAKDSGDATAADGGDASAEDARDGEGDALTLDVVSADAVDSGANDASGDSESVVDAPSADGALEAGPADADAPDVAAIEAAPQDAISTDTSLDMQSAPLDAAMEASVARYDAASSEDAAVDVNQRDQALPDVTTRDSGGGVSLDAGAHEGAPVAVDTTGAVDSGCSCLVGRRRASGRAWPELLALGLGWRWRRRRMRKPVSVGENRLLVFDA
jgi:hypothetical protein